VNGALQYLTRQGVLERVRVPGQRRYYFGLRPGTMEVLVARRLAVMGEISDLAERGVREFADRPAARARFEEVHEFYTWVETEMDALLDRFRESRPAKKPAKRPGKRVES